MPYLFSSASSAAPLLDEVHPVKANINVRDNKTTNIFFITCSPSVSWMFCFCCYMYHIGGRYPISFYQREGFIIQYEGLDEATGEKERPVSVLDMSLARIGEL